jgi:pSer/pThr/pTyr-binding forkhead associated (FHA) protein
LKDSRGVLLLAQGAEINDRLHAILQTRGMSLDIQACLRVVKGGPIDTEIPVLNDALRIGRRPDCDVQLPHALVSGHHCRVLKRERGVFLEDLRSRNGTFLNGQRLKGETELSDGDAIQVADSVFSVRIFAALAADSQQGHEAIQAWVLEESASKRRSASPYCATEAEIDLGSFP